MHSFKTHITTEHVGISVTYYFSIIFIKTMLIGVINKDTPSQNILVSEM
jgi:hypothetical protein